LSTWKSSKELALTASAHDASSIREEDKISVNGLLTLAAVFDLLLLQVYRSFFWYGIV